MKAAVRGRSGFRVELTSAQHENYTYPLANLRLRSHLPDIRIPSGVHFATARGGGVLPHSNRESAISFLSSTGRG
jgi:hypothetical protein